MVLALHVIAAEKPFNADDLKRFLVESGPFLDWVRTNHQERVMNRLMEQPQSIAEFPEAVQFLRDRKWEPQRFAYVLNHVIVGYKRLGMGREPSQLLARLEQTRAAVNADATQSESEKARTLEIVAKAQREAQKTDKAFAALPPEEVRLMWLHRTELQGALEGRLGISKRVLPNPAKTP
jgi:hypothetical protein